jgi:hypothetical protein
MTDRDPIANEARDLNIMNFKLTNGDDVVALVSRNVPSETYVIIEGGLLLNKYFDKRNNSYSYAFEEWSPLADDHVSIINRTNIVSYCEVNEKTKTSYLRTVIGLYASEHKAIEEDSDIEWPDDIDNSTFH